MWRQTNQVQIQKIKAPKTSKNSGQVPKSLKVLSLSKRDDSVASSDYFAPQQPSAITTNPITTIKQSQITKTLQGRELLELYDKVDHQRKVLNKVKQVLGDPTMTDQSIVERIQHLMTAKNQINLDHQAQLELVQNRFMMQIEDLCAQINRLQQSQLALQSFKSHDYDFLEQLEKMHHRRNSSNTALNGIKYHPANSSRSPKGTPIVKATQAVTQQMFKQSEADSSILKPMMGNHSTALTQDQGGLSLRLKEIRKKDKFSIAGSTSAEKQAMIELLISS